ncbi:pathogenicity locus [Methanoplanus sp. FWC-SCC4]|uniref:Pathogenicity locus n=2 Tax=Methanochimaera problematica TaxID=2609417 RepID=A0AA97FDW9_9EURY|nr:pathogenicity locus [Methanoplanus sp. FWC-SCC4]
MELTDIPGVGRTIAADLREAGYSSVSDLKGEVPEDIFFKINYLHRGNVHRSFLYVLRSAVYYADNIESRCLDPELLQWWKWMDG